MHNFIINLFLVGISFFFFNVITFSFSPHGLRFTFDYTSAFFFFFLNFPPQKNKISIDITQISYLTLKYWQYLHKRSISKLNSMLKNSIDSLGWNGSINAEGKPNFTGEVKTWREQILQKISFLDILLMNIFSMPGYKILEHG